MCQCKKCAYSDKTPIGRSCSKGVQFCTVSACKTCRLVMARCLAYEQETACTAFIANSKQARRLCKFCINFKGGKCLVLNKKVG
ncbi:hypothetical protein [Pelosinus propionicus]|uniref:Uncharacterized protein n=1 Tax=Pelosinus propionicus DSM 13327 TaxID=1123291 RepID=A0A1I4N2W2_9FIRM|nr:hypothetical protein [Pelosinus propionicus]SFM09818.1 hypothetical protein SAMN04490355_104068 [Pelosinus propionicus DSM 13327]